MLSEIFLTWFWNVELVMVEPAPELAHLDLAGLRTIRVGMNPIDAHPLKAG